MSRPLRVDKDKGGRQRDAEEAGAHMADVICDAMLCMSTIYTCTNAILSRGLDNADAIPRTALHCIDGAALGGVLRTSRLRKRSH